MCRTSTYVLHDLRLTYLEMPRSLVTCSELGACHQLAREGARVNETRGEGHVVQPAARLTAGLQPAVFTAPFKL